MAYLVDNRTDTLLARIYPQDKAKNAHGYRRMVEPPQPPLPQSNDDPIPALLRKILAEYAATGLPAAYLPKEESPIRKEVNDNE